MRLDDPSPLVRQTMAEVFAQALSLEDSDPRCALEAYRQAAEAEPANVATWTNWGRLLH